MQLNIDWGDPVLPAQAVLATQPSDLDGFYVSASGADKANLFFVLLTSFHHYLDGAPGKQPLI